MKKITLLFFLFSFFLLIQSSKKTIPVYLEIEEQGKVEQYHIECNPAISNTSFQNYFSKYEVTNISIKVPDVLRQKKISNLFFFEPSSFHKNIIRIQKEYEKILTDYALIKDLAREKLGDFYIESITLYISYHDLREILNENSYVKCQIVGV